MPPSRRWMRQSNVPRRIDLRRCRADGERHFEKRLTRLERARDSVRLPHRAPDTQPALDRTPARRRRPRRISSSRISRASSLGDVLRAGIAGERRAEALEQAVHERAGQAAAARVDLIAAPLLRLPARARASPQHAAARTDRRAAAKLSAIVGRRASDAPSRADDCVEGSLTCSRLCVVQTLNVWTCPDAAVHSVVSGAGDRLAASKRALTPAGRMSPRLPPNARHRASFTSDARYRRSRARVSATYSRRFVSSRSFAFASASASD